MGVESLQRKHHEDLAKLGHVSPNRSSFREPGQFFLAPISRSCPRVLSRLPQSPPPPSLRPRRPQDLPQGHLPRLVLPTPSAISSTPRCSRLRFPRLSIEISFSRITLPRLLAAA